MNAACAALVAAPIKARSIELAANFPRVNARGYHGGFR